MTLAVGIEVSDDTIVTLLLEMAEKLITDFVEIDENGDGEILPSVDAVGIEKRDAVDVAGIVTVVKRLGEDVTVLIFEIVAKIVADNLLLEVEVKELMRGVDVSRAVIDAVDDLDLIEDIVTIALVDAAVDNVATVETLPEPVIGATPVLCAEKVALALMTALDDPLVETVPLVVEAADNVFIIVRVLVFDIKADFVRIELGVRERDDSEVRVLNKVVSAEVLGKLLIVIAKVIKLDEVDVTLLLFELIRENDNAADREADKRLDGDSDARALVVIETTAVILVVIEDEGVIVTAADAREDTEADKLE